MPQGKGTYGTKTGRPPKKTNNIEKTTTDLDKGKVWSTGKGYHRGSFILPGINHGKEKN